MFVYVVSTTNNANEINYFVVCCSGGGEKAKDALRNLFMLEFG